MFEDIHEIAENAEFMKEVGDRQVCLDMLKQLPEYEELGELEEQLRAEVRIQRLCALSCKNMQCAFCFVLYAAAGCCLRCASKAWLVPITDNTISSPRIISRLTPTVSHSAN